jgi:hypothetical protein
MAAEGLIEEIRPRRPRSLRVFRRAFLPVVEIERMHEEVGYDA